MRKLALTIGVALVFGLAAQARADSLIFDFDDPSGPLGTSQSYTAGGITITAYGYAISHKHDRTIISPAKLYGKDELGDEHGLGIKSDSDHEINSNSFIQLDLTQLLAAMPNITELQIGSVQHGETFALYESNTLGSMGTLLSKGNFKDDEVLFPFSLKDGNSFLSITAPSGNVLLSSLSADPAATPEPATIGMLGAGLLLVGGMRFRKKKS